MYVPIIAAYAGVIARCAVLVISYYKCAHKKLQGETPEEKVRKTLKNKCQILTFFGYTIFDLKSKYFVYFCYCLQEQCSGFFLPITRIAIFTGRYQ